VRPKAAGICPVYQNGTFVLKLYQVDAPFEIPAVPVKAHHLAPGAYATMNFIIYGRDVRENRGLRSGGHDISRLQISSPVFSEKHLSASLFLLSS